VLGFAYVKEPWNTGAWRGYAAKVLDRLGIYHDPLHEGGRPKVGILLISSNAFIVLSTLTKPVASCYIALVKVISLSTLHAIAHTNPSNSLATAITATLCCFPRDTIRTYLR
jgi:hypothetical protein